MAPRLLILVRNLSRSALSVAILVREPSMLDPRLIATAPLLCMLACTASYPDDLGKPDELVIADDLDAAPISPPTNTPRPGASATSEGTISYGNTGLVGSGGSTSRAERSLYSASRIPRVPTVRQARPEVVGALDEDLIRRTVQTHIREVRRCYDKVLDRDPNAKGRVEIAFEIDGKGKVPAATVHESTMKDPAGGECIAAAVAGWKFPKPRTGTVKVVYAFVLEPG
jgi:hypothetical protein